MGFSMKLIYGDGYSSFKEGGLTSAEPCEKKNRTRCKLRYLRAQRELGLHISPDFEAIPFFSKNQKSHVDLIR